MSPKTDYFHSLHSYRSADEDEKSSGRVSHLTMRNFGLWDLVHPSSFLLNGILRCRTERSSIHLWLRGVGSATITYMRQLEVVMFDVQKKVFSLHLSRLQILLSTLCCFHSGPLQATPLVMGQKSLRSIFDLTAWTLKRLRRYRTDNGEHPETGSLSIFLVKNNYPPMLPT